MPISYNYKKIFIHIPKCGGSSINEVLDTNSYEELYSPHYIKFTSIFIEKNKFDESEHAMCIYKTPQHLTYRELEKIVPSVYFSNYSIFSVVRNPYDRLVSEYYFLMEIAESGAEKITIPKCSFENFLEYLSMNQLERNKKFDGHLETQTHYLLNSKNQIAENVKIYKFENIQECFSDLKGEINFETTPHLRKAKNRKHYSEYYNKDTAKIVSDFYKDDFKNFNYDIAL